jgi:quercetin dioxygenase-like cupin family protein
MIRSEFVKSLLTIPVEAAHGGSGSRQLILSSTDPISKKLEAMTKGFLAPGRSYDWHSHSGIDEFFIVLNGVGEVHYRRDDGAVTIYKYKQGDIFYSPADLVHKIDCLENEQSEFFFIRVYVE